MQLMENTAKEVAAEIERNDIDLKDPECNIEIGTKYFKNLINYYDRKLLSSYYCI